MFSSAQTDLLETRASENPSISETLTDLEGKVFNTYRRNPSRIQILVSSTTMTPMIDSTEKIAFLLSTATEQPTKRWKAVSQGFYFVSILFCCNKFSFAYNWNLGCSFSFVFHWSWGWGLVITTFVCTWMDKITIRVTDDIISPFSNLRNSWRRDYTHYWCWSLLLTGLIFNRQM